MRTWPTLAGQRRLSREQVIDLLTQTTAPGAHRFLGMGFRMYDVEVAADTKMFGDFARARFECVCGRIEYFQQIMDRHTPLEVMNLYDGIVNFGATSRKHLLDDKFTEPQIDDMERRLREFKMTREIAERAWHDVRGLRVRTLPVFTFPPQGDTYEQRP